MRALQRLHEKYKLNGRLNKKFHLNHQYDRKTKTWKFVGYKCTVCDRIVRADKSVEYHDSRCTRTKYVVLADRLDPDHVTIITKNRTVWHPLEINQISGD